jgi:hypothetical protein
MAGECEQAVALLKKNKRVNSFRLQLCDHRDLDNLTPDIEFVTESNVKIADKYF